MTHSNKDFKQYLSPTFFIDSDNQTIVDYANSVVQKASSEKEKAIHLYYAIRDDIYYDPYSISVSTEKLKASYTLAAKAGFCVAKAILLAAVSRAIGIPSRLGFADVKNHLTTETLKELMETDVFTYHGYTELFLDEKWVKATPAFNRSLCEKFHIKPLEFEGEQDSIFHQYDKKGNKHMEYINDHGQYADVPLEEMIGSYRKHYPKMMAFFELKEEDETPLSIDGNFEDEAKPII